MSPHHTAVTFLYPIKGTLTKWNNMCKSFPFSVSALPPFCNGARFLFPD